LVFTAPKFHVFGAFILNRKVTAVKFADQIFESDVDSSGIAMQFAAVKIVFDRDKPNAIERENPLTDLDKTTKPCGVADKSKVRQGKHFLWRTFIILASGRK